MRDKLTEGLIEKLHGPVTSTNDLIFRGQSPAPVITDYANNKLGWWDRFINNAYTNFLKAKLVEDTSVNKSRQPVARFTFNPNVQLRIPQYNYPELFLLSKTHWLLRTIFRAIIGEVINTGWEIEPRFKHKCRKCGKEYDTPNKPEECEICESKRFDTPNIEQYKTFTRLLTDPAPGQDKSFTEFIRSTLWYNLGLDDFYWEIGHTVQYDTVTQSYIRTPIGIRVLDSSLTLPVQDVYGGFSSTEYFCPICYKEQYYETGQDTYVDSQSISLQQQNASLKCKRCGEPLARTAYKQIVNGKVVARFAEDEVIHASTERVDPDTFGQSKIAAAIKHLLILDYMDEYNYQTYSHGHVNKLLFLVGSDQDEIDRINVAVNNALSSNSRRDIQTGDVRRSMESAMVMIGQEEGKNVVGVDIMPDLTAMQSLDYYRLYVNKVAGIYGVTPIFVNFAESETGGQNPRTEIDVQNRVTRRYMHDILEPFNNKLLPALDITDWILKFGEIESRDMLRDAQIKHQNIMAVSLAIGAGFDVEVSPDATKYTLSPKPVREPEARSREEAGKTPQDKDGAPNRTMPDGSDTGTPMLEPEEEKPDE